MSAIESWALEMSKQKKKFRRVITAIARSLRDWSLRMRQTGLLYEIQLKSIQWPPGQSDIRWHSALLLKTNDFGDDVTPINL